MFLFFAVYSRTDIRNSQHTGTDGRRAIGRTWP